MPQNLPQISLKNPIYHHGIDERFVENYFRNYNCSEYDDCLMKAARENSFLDCSLCPLKDSKRQSVHVSYEELFGCRRLLHAIFYSKDNN